MREASVIEAGPETNLAVAKACGIAIHSVDDFGHPQVVKPGPWERQAFENPNGGPPIQFAPVMPFWPSVDLNDAFLAAESFGLFDRQCCQMGKLDANVWDVSKYEDTAGRNGFYHLAAGPTAALAMCAAILKLAENPESSRRSLPA